MVNNSVGQCRKYLWSKSPNFKKTFSKLIIISSIYHINKIKDVYYQWTDYCRKQNNPRKSFLFCFIFAVFQGWIHGRVVNHPKVLQEPPQNINSPPSPQKNITLPQIKLLWVSAFLIEDIWNLKSALLNVILSLWLHLGEGRILNPFSPY